MKIAIYHELPQGGARRAVNEFAKILKKTNQVDLYALGNKSDFLEEKYYTNTIFYRFNSLEWKGKNWRVRLYKDTIELFKLYLLNKKISKEIFKKKYDILFIHASKFIEAPFVLRFDSAFKVFYLHDPNYRMIYEPFDFPEEIGWFKLSYEKINRLIRKYLDKKNVFGASSIIANSLFTKRVFEKTYRIKSEVSYLGVDADFFVPGRKEKDIDILFIGSKSEYDGYSLFKELEQFYSKKLTFKILSYDTEWVSDDKKMRDYYQRSKIVLCLARKEPFGLVPLEAMACGAVVIAVDEGGYKESIVNDKTGFLVDRNRDDFIDKIDWVLSHNTECKKIVEHARGEVLKNWKWEKRGKELEKLFKKYLSK